MDISKYAITLYMETKKILIVQDETNIREAMAEAITDADFVVLTAENGQIGLQIALKEQPDLILLD